MAKFVSNSISTESKYKQNQQIYLLYRRVRQQQITKKNRQKFCQSLNKSFEDKSVSDLSNTLF